MRDGGSTESNGAGKDNKINTKNARVFISYSRRDLTITRLVASALERRSIEVRMDERDLPTFQDWERELHGLMVSADAVLVVVSPHWTASPACKWELEQATLLNKRLAPVIVGAVDDRDVPKELARINWFQVPSGGDIEPVADKLAEALTRDIDWIKEHTRLGELARVWTVKGRGSSWLLSGYAIDEAERWIAARPANAPGPTRLHQEFLTQSRAAATQRLQRRVYGFAGLAGLSLVGIAALGWLWYVANSSLGLANDVSRQVGGEIAERLSNTDGVPPNAVASILQGAGKMVTRIILTPKIGGGDTASQRLIEIEILTRSAAASFAAGDYDTFDQSAAAIDAELETVCKSAAIEAQCTLRRAILNNLRAERSLWDVSQGKEKLAQAEATALAVRTSLEKAVVSPSNSELGMADLFQRHRASLLAIEAMTRNNKLREAAELAAACTNEMQPVVGEGAAYSAGRDSILALASCERVLAVRRLAVDPAALDDSKHLLDTSATRLDALRKANETDVVVQFASIATAFETAILASPDGKPRNLAAVNAVRLRFEKLIDENKRNFQFRNVYLYESARLLNKDQALLDGKDLLSALEHRVNYLSERLRSRELSAGERAVRRTDFFVTLKRLYELQRANNAHKSVAELQDRFADLFDLKSAVTMKDPKDQSWVGSQFKAYTLAADSYRKLDREVEAIRVFLDIATTAEEPAIAALKLAPTEAGADNWLNDHLIYFWSEAVRQLGAIRKEQFPNPAKLDEALTEAKVIVKRARDSDSDNYEFRKAHADLLAAQGWRLARDSIEKAHPVYLEAAELGASDAIDQLKSWVIDRKGPRSGEPQIAEFYERQRREHSPVKETVPGTSRIFTEQTVFDVYLLPPKQGEDVVDRELERLKRYYRVAEFKPEGVARLKSIMAAARKSTRNDSPSAITTRLIEEARKSQLADDALRAPFGRKAIGDELSAATTALNDGNLATALAKLDFVRTLLEKQALGSAALPDWAFAAAQYGRVEFKRIEKERLENRVLSDDTGARARTGREYAIRQIKAVADKPLPEAAAQLSELGENTLALLKHAQSIQDRTQKTVGQVELTATLFEQGLKILEALKKGGQSDARLMTALADTHARRAADLRTLAISAGGDRQKQYDTDAIRAYTDAFAAYVQLAREQRDDRPARHGMAKVLRDQADILGSAEVKEHDSARRQAEQSLKFATDLWKGEQNDLDALQQMAEAEKTLGDIDQRAAGVVYENAKHWQKVGALANDDILIDVIDKLLDSYNAAERHYEAATQHRVRLLRNDPDKDCACKVDNLVDAIVTSMSERLRIERIRRRSQERNASTISPAEERLQERKAVVPEVTKYLDQKIADWRGVLEIVNPNTKTSGANNLDVSDEERLFRYYVALAQVRKGYTQVASINEIKDATFVEKAYGDALASYDSAAQEMKFSYGKFNDEVDKSYAVLLGDLIFTNLMAKNPERARAVMALAQPIVEEYGLNWFDLKINEGHTLLLNGREADALKIYGSEANDLLEVAKTEGGVKIKWREQVVSDLKALAAVYPTNALGTVIEKIRQQWNANDDERKRRRQQG